VGVIGVEQHVVFVLNASRVKGLRDGQDGVDCELVDTKV
jgi:hypothetical protein